MIKWDATHIEQVKAMSEADLVAACQQTTGKPGDVTSDAMLAEIKRRNLGT